MWKNVFLVVIPVLFYNVAHGQYIFYKNTDLRFVENGFEVPNRNYADQPYVIVCEDGSWLCTITTSSGIEHAYMNNIIATKSYDHGKNWTVPINIEPPGMPQSSWAVPLKVPGGRIYVFYNYNKHNFSGLEGVMSGPFAFRYSDDNGRTWSENRYEVAIRTTQIDRENYTQGKHQFFWSIDKPVVSDEAAYIAISKILRTDPNQPDFHKRSEGFILKSENILHEKNPEKISWVTLPEGENGIWNPEFGKVQEEHNMVILENGNLYVTYRTINGYAAYAISSDQGKTFSKPSYMHYANGEPLGNPRACPKIHKTKEGNYLFWYHNNFKQNSYPGRNPVWLSGGIEKDGDIKWSQPEIILYDWDPAILGMSYPDFIEQDGRMWVIETQKKIARVHEIDPSLIQGMWRQGMDTLLVEDGLIMDSDFQMLKQGSINFPQLPNLKNGGGFSIDLWLTVNKFKSGQKILNTIGGAKNKGFQVALSENNTIEMQVNDGEMRSLDISEESRVISDQNTITERKLHHVVFVFDGAARIASVVVDGVLSDGSIKTREYGWSRIYPFLKDLNDTNLCYIDKEFDGAIHHIRVYNRSLKTSEAIANFNHGLK